VQRLRRFLKAHGSRIRTPGARSFETEGEAIECGLVDFSFLGFKIPIFLNRTCIEWLRQLLAPPDREKSRTVVAVAQYRNKPI